MQIIKELGEITVNNCGKESHYLHKHSNIQTNVIVSDSGMQVAKYKAVGNYLEIKRKIKIKMCFVGTISTASYS